MIGAILLGMTFRLLGPADDGNVVLEVGRYVVSDPIDRNSMRDGTLVVTVAQPNRSFGYIDWKTMVVHGRTIEQFVAIPGEEAGKVTLLAFHTESLGSAVNPRLYSIVKGAIPQSVRGGVSANYFPPRRTTAWSVKWAGERLPDLASQFAPDEHSLDDRGLALRALSRWRRIHGTEQFDVASLPILSDLCASKDDFARAIAQKTIDLSRVQTEFNQSQDLTPMAEQFQGEMQQLMVKALLQSMMGQEPALSEVGRAFGSEHGSFDEAYKQQIKAATLAVEGLAGEQQLRELVRAKYFPDRDGIDRLESDAFEAEVLGEDDYVLIRVTNRTGRKLTNVVICPEFRMDASKVSADILARNVAELPFQFLLPLMGMDEKVAKKASASVDFKTALFAAPYGSLTYLEEWDPDIEIVVPAGPRVGHFARYVESGSLWVGADGTEFDATLDVNAMCDSLEQWRASGCPRRSWRPATNFERARKGSPDAASGPVRDPLSVAREIGATRPAGFVYTTNSADFAKNPDVVFLLEVMESLERGAAATDSAVPSKNVEPWRKFLTLSGISSRDRESFSALLRQKSPTVRGLEIALLGTGCGKAVDPDDVQPGDFVQYWWKPAKDRDWKVENMRVGIVSKVELSDSGRKLTLFGAHRTLLAAESSLKAAERKGGIGEWVPIRPDDPSTCIPFFARWTKLPATGR